MSRSERDATRTVRLWLDEGATALPDRVLDVVLDQLPATPQRRPTWLARRSPNMSRFLTVGLASAAVVVVALLGFTYLVGPNPGSPGETSPTPAPSPTLITGQGDHTLSVGRYVAGEPFSYALGFDISAADWNASIGGPYGVFLNPIGDAAQDISVTIFTDVAADPCAGTGSLVPPPGSTVDELVTAFTAMPGVAVANVSDTLVDGYAGTRLTLTATEDYAQCSLGPDGYIIWTLPLGAVESIPEGGQVRVRILDVDGQRVVIGIKEAAGVSADLRAEFDAVVNSMTIDPLP